MEDFEKMPILNAHAAGIDVGSKSHFAAVGQKDEDVKEFGIYSRDHDSMIKFLQENKIRTIAMESTGSYWQTLFSALQDAGFEVLLVSGHQTKNVLAKTDVKDSRWIQKLHSLGLLQGCFLPSQETARLRVLHRHRQSLIEEASKMTNKMQKSLRLMNLRLDKVLSDITGKSGSAIIEAILKGERSGTVLSQFADLRVKKSREEIAAALQGHWSGELLLELEDCFDLYKILQKKIANSEKKIEQLLLDFTEASGFNKHEDELTKKQLKGKNQPRIDLPNLGYKYYGVDLLAIDSISTGTVLTLICEIGDGVYKFKTAKQFAKFLRLAPNNRISGGKVISSRTPKGANKFALALRNAANTIDNKKEGVLYHFFKRMAYKKGRGAAITATARKMAVIIWNMITKHQEYKPIQSDEYKEIIKQKRIKNIRKMMLNSDIDIDELALI